MVEEAELGARVMSNCLPICNERYTNNGGCDSKQGYDATINLEFLYYNSEKERSVVKGHTCKIRNCPASVLH